MEMCFFGITFSEFFGWETPGRAFLCFDFNHGDAKKARLVPVYRERTRRFFSWIWDLGFRIWEFFLTQITRMAQICADFENPEGLTNHPRFGITQRETAYHHRTKQ